MTGPTDAQVYGAHWRKLRLEILNRDGWLCQIRSDSCTEEADEVDHIIPWRVGGAMYDPDNLRAACGACNRSRARRDTIGRAQKIARPSQEW